MKNFILGIYNFFSRKEFLNNYIWDIFKKRYSSITNKTKHNEKK